MLPFSTICLLNEMFSTHFVSCHNGVILPITNRQDAIQARVLKIDALEPYFPLQRRLCLFGNIFS